MRKLAFIPFLITLAVAAPVEASRDQSYFTSDAGGTVVRQGDDEQEIEGRINLPVFPGDTVTTGRRGRSEIRLSDGNVIALDSSTEVYFRSILDAFEGEAAQTVIELRYGRLAVHRTDVGREFIRLDTEGASYVATHDAIYAVETDRGRDRLTVFEGDVEVRTPQRTDRLRGGETANVDANGVYSRSTHRYTAIDDFEQWFVARSERHSGRSRYLDRSLAYADADLSEHGTWVYVTSYNGWAWRPRVGIGWRPYYHGEWVRGPGGSLVWVSYESWGWVPYHYGRWTLDPGYGWVWYPGSGYSPAWVYWMYGSGYVGWAPAGWWEVYKPYYNWCYRPNVRASWDGWYGRIHGRDIDFRPWTFVQPNHIVRTRVDRSALTNEIVRDRLLRGSGDGFATIGTGAARFTRNDLRDPGAAVNNIVRRGSSSGSSGSAPDMTPFIRRDPELSGSIRDRIARTRPADGGSSASGGSIPSANRGTSGGGVVSRGGSTPAATRPGWGSGSVPRGGDSGTTVPSTRGGSDRGSSDRGGVVRRGGESSGSRGSDRSSTGREAPPSWRGSSGSGVIRRHDTVGGETERGSSPSQGSSPSERLQRPTDGTPVGSPSAGWRSRAVGGGGTEPRQSSGGNDGDRSSSGGGSSDVPRRVIDRIGGPRLVEPGDSGRSRSPRESPRESPPPARVDRRSEGGSSSPRYSPPARESAPPRTERSSPPPQPAPQSSPSRSEGGRVRRDH